MTKTNACEEKKELSLSDIRSIMAKPCPCLIVPKEALNPSTEEKREFYGYLTESERDRLSEETD